MLFEIRTINYRDDCAIGSPSPPGDDLCHVSVSALVGTVKLTDISLFIDSLLGLIVTTNIND